MQSVIETLDGATTSGLSSCSMRWVPAETRQAPIWRLPAEPDVERLCRERLEAAAALVRERAVMAEFDRLVRLSVMRSAYRVKRGRRW